MWAIPGRLGLLWLRTNRRVPLRGGLHLHRYLIAAD
jgi:hypothetical protein